MMAADSCLSEAAISAGASLANTAGDDASFKSIRRLIREYAGIELGADRLLMVRTRLRQRMQSLGLSSLVQYLNCLRSDLSRRELSELVDALTTNVSDFYRHPSHFERITELVCNARSSGQERFRFWSAGCAAGQEPYTLALALLDAGLVNGTDIRILATDISQRALALAVAGRYSPEQLAAVPDRLRRRHFEPVATRAGAPPPGLAPEPQYSARPELRDLVLFRSFNLADMPYRFAGGLDAILCRNVLMYLNPAIRDRVLVQLHRALRPGGMLVLGVGETLADSERPFLRLEPSIYLAGPGGRAPETRRPLGWLAAD